MIGQLRHINRLSVCGSHNHLRLWSNGGFALCNTDIVTGRTLFCTLFYMGMKDQGKECDANVMPGSKRVVPPGRQ